MSNDDDFKFEDVPMEDASFHTLPKDKPVDDPSPTPPADPPAPAKAPPGARRPGTAKMGALKGGAPLRPSGAPRPGGARVVMPPRPQAGSKAAKYAMVAILILIPGLLAAGYFMGTWNKFLILIGVMSKATPAPKPLPPPHFDLDDEFKKAGDAVADVEAFITTGELKVFEDKHAAAKPAIEDVKAILNACDLVSAKLAGAVETITNVRNESQKPPGARSTSIATADAKELERKAAGLGETLKGRYEAWQKVKRELAPPRHAESGVMPDPLTASSMSPWADLAAGTWWRVRKVDAKTKVEVHEDTVVESVEGGVVKGRMIAFSNGKKEEMPLEMPAVDAGAKIGAEEKVEVGGKDYATQIAEMSGPGSPIKLWICRDPIALNFVPLKGEGASSSFKVTSIATEELNVGGRLVPCVVIDVETTLAGSTLKQREWYSKAVPGWIVRRESPEGSLELVQYGGAADAREPFPGEVKPTPTPVETPTPTPTASASPTPPPPDPKVIAQQKLDEGGALLAEASPLFKEVAAAMNELPDDKEKLNALIAKAADAAAKFDAAIAKYLEGRDLAPDPPAIDKRIAGIGKLKGKLAEYVELIKAKLPK